MKVLVGEDPRAAAETMRTHIRASMANAMRRLEPWFRLHKEFTKRTRAPSSNHSRPICPERKRNCKPKRLLPDRLYGSLMPGLERSDSFVVFSMLPKSRGCCLFRVDLGTSAVTKSVNSPAVTKPS